MVQIAALVHDVGLLKLADDVVRRPPSALSNAGRVQYERHPVIGHALLGSVEQLAQIGLWVRHHHERWDGKGYPDRRAGHSIPLRARLIALASGYLEAVAGEGGTALLWRQEQRHSGAYDPGLVSLLSDVVMGRPVPVEIDPNLRVPVQKSRRA
jgi:HD-GYP domain-containing protein (c-di-GMP phosphodiesterase class II)